MKIEECVKKGKEHHEEILQRAVAAEVSPGHLVTDRCSRLSLVCSVFNYISGMTTLLENAEAEGSPVTHSATAARTSALCSPIAF